MDPKWGLELVVFRDKVSMVVCEEVVGLPFD